ncbi:helix-turn-helix transcriptional regulator [Shimia litoralis]|uniref:helix-turn-helix transcriptional regulator n=1 Tax=Shimia litoralis TaxID=420403 RepID=UPI001FE24F7B|nr:LuxR family transcriptional regulator [Shimia litoralis]
MSVWSEIEKIESQTTLTSLWEQAQTTFQSYGFPFAIYVATDDTEMPPFVRTNIPEVYSENPPADDPFLRYCCYSYEHVFTGSEFLDSHSMLTAEERAFIVAAGERTGYVSGLALPMRLRGSDRFGGFILGTRLKRRECTVLVDANLDNIRLLCLMIHRRLEEILLESDRIAGFRERLISPKMDADAVLSPRQAEVMFLFAQGLSTKEAAQVCNISPHTVSEYAKESYRKLGVRNRVEAVLKLKH